MSSTSVPKSDVEVPSGRNSFRNSLRSSSLRRSDSVGEDGAPADGIDINDDDDDGRTTSRLSAALAAEREETRIRLSKELEGEDDSPVAVDSPDGDDEEDDDEEDDEPEGEGATMSLMDLLEETDRKAGIQGPTYRLDQPLETDEEEEEDDKECGCEICCSVCRVKHKGAPLTPCGHAYCRMCSREMSVQKGYCPVCSNFVMEIMDIF